MKKRAGKVLALLGLSAVLLSGCTSNEEVEVSGDLGEKFSGEWIVDANYAAERVGNEDVIFIDARGEKMALMGTVKGAVATDWTTWAITEGRAGDEKWGCMQEPADISKTLGNLGISKDKEIILFEETVDGWGGEARLLWQLRASGYTDVKMVDGGYKALKASGAKTQMGGEKLEPVDVEVTELDYSHTMTTDVLQNNYDDYKIIDVRTVEEYNGAVLYDEAKGGHLPEAIHVPYLDLFKEDGTLKSNAELTSMFENAGLSKDDAIVAYCTGGIRSAYMQLVLEMCGFENSYNYDQSYWRWAVVGEVE